MDFNDRKRVEKMFKSISSIYGDIDACIGNLVKSRLNKDTELEGKASAEMESLMVASAQEFTCIMDFLKDLLKVEESDDIIAFMEATGNKQENENNSVPTMEVSTKLVDDIIRYCETQAIYDKLSGYGDFYYKLKQIRK